MPSIVRPSALVLGLVLVSMVMLPAQGPPTSQKFTTGTELVIVDFVVTDKADRPVRGLTAKDFVVKEDGKERPITRFEAFAGDEPAATAARPAAPAASAAAATASPVASTVLLVDDSQ